jgi:hypothetical protein
MIFEPDTAALCVERQRRWAMAGEALRALRQHANDGAGPELRKPLDGDLQHRHVAEVEQVVSAGLDQDLRVIAQDASSLPGDFSKSER